MKLYYDITLKGKEISIEFHETKYADAEFSEELEWALNKSDHEAELPSDEDKAILEAVDDAKWSGNGNGTGHIGLIKHLSAACQSVADEYGYTSPEYTAICAITNAIAN